jgi:hypothetical protein
MKEGMSSFFIFLAVFFEGIHSTFGFTLLAPLRRLFFKSTSINAKHALEPFLPSGFTLDPNLKERPTKPKQPIRIDSLEQLKDMIFKGYRVVR